MAQVADENLNGENGQRVVVELERLQYFKEKNDAEYKNYSNPSLTGVKDVKGALNALADKASSDEVTLTEEGSAQDGYAKSYKFQKGSSSPVYINIPKDMVVSGGRVVTNPSGQAAGTYLELTLANATNDKLYINVGDLIEYVTSGSATADKVQVAVDGSTHKVTASIKAGSIELSDLNSGVQTTINSVSGKVDKEAGKGLSTNDFTDEDKENLASLSGAVDELGDRLDNLNVTSFRFATNADIDAMFLPSSDESQAGGATEQP